MANACACSLSHQPPVRPRACHECGTACCPSCSLEIDRHAFCRWCATQAFPARAR